MTQNSPMTEQPTHIPPKPPQKAQDPREMYAEISALVGALAKAFGLKDAETTEALESGRMRLNFAADANGNRFVAATCDGKTVRVYQDAIKHAEPRA